MVSVRRAVPSIVPPDGADDGASPAREPVSPAPGLLPSRGMLRAEVLLVLGVSLGRSAVYSLIALAQALAAGPLATSPPR